MLVFPPFPLEMVPRACKHPQLLWPAVSGRAGSSGTEHHTSEGEYVWQGGSLREAEEVGHPHNPTKPAPSHEMLSCQLSVFRAWF